MADSLELRTPQDASRISLSEDWEIRYWTNKFQVTEAELRAAVATVGNSSAAVARWLQLGS